MIRVFVAGVLLLGGIAEAAARGGGRGGGGRAPSYRSNGYGTGANPSGHYVRPYVRTDGQPRDGHYQSNPNNTRRDNWSTRPNVNPHTGQPGTRLEGIY